jgi:hypothetical protein
MIDSFPTPETDNIGGCRAFLFIESEKVVLIPVSAGRQVKSQITLINGASWRIGYATQKTLEFSEKMQENDSGKYFLPEITGFYPKVSEGALAIFSEMKYNTFIVLITDNNGFTRVVGTIDNPLEFRFDTASGQSPSSRNGFSFSFRGQAINESPFYTVDLS